MIDLDLTAWQNQLQVRREQEQLYVFDPIRMKWLVLQPEELVRQLMLHYLMEERQYKKSRIRVEQGISVNGLSRRCDIVVYDQEVRPWLLVECKSPKISITQSTFEQIANYNLPLAVKYLVVSNGLATYCCEMDYESRGFRFLSTIPEYS